jgi:hypothetical protein
LESRVSGLRIENNVISDPDNPAAVRYLKVPGIALVKVDFEFLAQALV